MDYLGQPLDEATKAVVQAAAENPNDAATAAIQHALDPHCLAVINVNPESRVKLQPGPVKPLLVESGWTVFLIKVHNEAGVTAQLRGMSPNAASMVDSPKEQMRDRWLDLSVYDGEPMDKTLSGLIVEYRLVQLYSRDAGMREAKLLFDVGQGTQDLGFRNEIDILFKCLPAQNILLQVLDNTDEPTSAGFEIRDQYGRLYPAESKRSALDVSHPEVYRSHGDSLRLSPGRYIVKVTNSSQIVAEVRTVEVTCDLTQLSFKVPTSVAPPQPDSSPGSSPINGLFGSVGAMWCFAATVVGLAVGVQAVDALRLHRT